MPANASRELAALAARVEGMSKTWKLESRTVLRDVVNSQAVPAVRAAARAQLPKSGGLNEWVAAEPVGVRTSMTPRSVGVRMAQPYPGARQTNSGWVRHPTFKRRGRGDWHNEEIPGAAGWWTKTLMALGPAVTAELVVMIREMNAAISRSKWGG